jgi:class 3 adenylate cyclase/tetratricopeptide (TPR) repeat protein
MPAGRRKLAAIMFTDMVGFSALAQRDEPLALRLMDEHRRLLRPVYGRFGGREVKTMGDGALVEFESALDATECAVEMQRVLFERNRGASHERIDLRIGIHVGDVVHAEDDVYGDAVNIASRIEPLSDPGGVCVSGPVVEQVRNKIPYPLEPVAGASLKNIETPVTVWRVGLPWTLPDLQQATPFTDRSSELDVLRAAQSMAASGQGTTVAITGEVGVGKTRLVDEFLARAGRDRLRVIRGRGSREGVTVPFFPWAEAVRDFARDAPSPLLYAACAECATELVRLVPELRSRLAPAVDTGPSEPTELQLFEGVLRFLENLGRDDAVVLALDDLQWVDSASVHLLEHLARRLAGRRVLLLLAFRDDEVPERGRLRPVVTELAREHRLRELRLARFDPATSGQLLGQLLRGRLPPSEGELAAQLFAKSGGNPMVLEATVRALVEDGALAWTETGWVLKPGADVRLPPGVQSIVRRRLERLDPATVDLLRQGAVLGPEFSFEALRRVSGVAAEDLLGRLEEALRSHILEERAVGSGGSTYVFADRAVRETLYEEVSLVRRSLSHASAARALEALRAEGQDVPAGELADHFLRANDFPKALEHTVRAAQEAARLYAREESLRHYAVALELLEAIPDDRKRAEVLFQSGEQLDLLGRHSEAYRSMREAAELYERVGAPLRAGEVHRSIARRIAAHNEMVRASEHLEKARRLLEAQPPSVELSRLYDTMGAILFQQVRMPEASEALHRAIEIASKIGAEKVLASSQMMLASIVPPQTSAMVFDYLEKALEGAKRIGARQVVSNTLLLRAIALLQIQGDGRGALRAAEDAIEYARQGRDVLYEMATKGGLLTYIHWRLGEFEQAERVALEHRSFAAGDSRRERPTALTVLGEIALARGDCEHAERLLWEAERLLADGGDWTESVQTQIGLARCALRRARPGSAVEHLATALALCRKAGPPAMDALFEVETLALLVRAHLSAGAADEAARRLAELEEFCATFDRDVGKAFRARARAELQLSQGNPAEATALLEEAIGLWSRLGWQYERAETQLALASSLRASGEMRRASAASDQAEEFLARVGVPHHR